MDAFKELRVDDLESKKNKIKDFIQQRGLQVKALLARHEMFKLVEGNPTSIQ